MILLLSLQLGPTKTLKILQIFNLIEKSVRMFGQKLTADEENLLTANEVQIQSSIDGGHGPHWLPHRVNPCQDRLILVNFARLSLHSKPNTTKSWIKRFVYIQPAVVSPFICKPGSLHSFVLLKCKSECFKRLKFAQS